MLTRLITPLLGGPPIFPPPCSTAGGGIIKCDGDLEQRRG